MLKRLITILIILLVFSPLALCYFFGMSVKIGLVMQLSAVMLVQLKILMRAVAWVNEKL